METTQKKKINISMLITLPKQKGYLDSPYKLPLCSNRNTSKWKKTKEKRNTKKIKLFSLLNDVKHTWNMDKRSDKMWLTFIDKYLHIYTFPCDHWSS